MYISCNLELSYLNVKWNYYQQWCNISGNFPPSVANGPKVRTQPSRLPSFTEVNFSDLSSLASSPSSVVTKDSLQADEVDPSAAGIKEELENILHQLDQIFPLTEPESEF